MVSGKDKFEFQLGKLDIILGDASLEINPEEYLYRNDGRTPLFMLQGLCRLYGEIYNKNKFEKLKDLFKLFEDHLGAIDYYEYYSKSFSENTKVPQSIKDYMNHQLALKLEALKQNLYSHGWLEKKGNRFKEIKKILNEIDWSSEKKEINAIQEYYIKEIEAIKKFISKYGKPFTEVENHVHELRRDVRWLSIYPHALLGQIQYANRTGSGSTLIKYLTEDVINSKYNKFPEVGNHKRVLLLDIHHFFALSWVIAEIGKLKDEGLEYFALLDAFHHSEIIPENQAAMKAIEVLGWNDRKISELLLSATELAKQSISDGIFDGLVFGTAKVYQEN